MAALTSPMALVIWISRGQAMVQFEHGVAAVHAGDLVHDLQAFSSGLVAVVEK